MTGLRRLAAGPLGLAAAALLLLALAPVRRPEPRLPLGWGLAVGLAAGTGVFAALARDLRPRTPNRALARALPAIALGAGAEETIWRWGALGGLTPLIGYGAAFGAATAGFALAHGELRSPRRVGVRVLLGAAFGGVFVLTGRLSVAVVAHAFYNLLVVGACVASPERGHAGTACR